MSVFPPRKSEATDAFFNAFKADAKVEADGYDVVAFGDSPQMADELLDLVLSGVKRATASLARGAPPPSVGGYVVLTDGRGKPRCVWRTTEAAVMPLTAVDDDFAWDEGEGLRTRDDWLRAHREYFGRVAAAQGFAMDDAMPTVFERFTIVWPRLFADGWKGPRPV